MSSGNGLSSVPGCNRPAPGKLHCGPLGGSDCPLASETGEIVADQAGEPAWIGPSLAVLGSLLLLPPSAPHRGADRCLYAVHESHTTEQ